MDAICTDTSPRARASALLLTAGSLLAIVLTAATLRIAVTSTSPLGTWLVAELQLGPSQIGFIGTLPPLCFCVLGLATPGLISRFGIHAVAIAAMTTCAVAMAARSQTGSFAIYAVATAMSLAAMGVGNVLLPPLTKQHFPAHQDSVTTTYIFTLQLGMVVPPLLAVSLAESWGWRTSLGVWALVPALAAPALAVAWRAALRTPAPRPVEITGVQPSSRRWTSLTISLTIVMGTTSLTTYTILAWLPDIVIHAGLTPAQAGSMVAVFGAAGLAATLAVPRWVARASHPIAITSSCSVAYLVGFLGLIHAPGQHTWLWAACVGWGSGMFSFTLVMINRKTRTLAGAATVSGLVQGVGYAIAALGPLGFGLLTRPECFAPGLYVMVTVAVIMYIATVFTLRAPPFESAR
ncbi:MFS transporter [Aeromicrobium choanae]|uniref:MFS transporter, CP family, cyanate transporter n=1 Tax=Aeromicrobium choanae TaxID=1736691 RepID=A0A1T4YX74_9ACTN|nr:MFS transporter [Aeromicrobium choanae]SKB06399.1 MFS transporter, CP family, cyanate transporter [Aeromicrobium choanae]